MKRPAVFFDRDNTLIANDGYLGEPSRVELMDGAASAIARVRSLGYATVVVSNQSGVARGKFDEDAVHSVNARLDSLLIEQNPLAVIDRHEFCPFHPDAVIEPYRQDSPLRKPKPGMLLTAAGVLGLDLPGSWLIGDAPRDIAAGRAAGCRTILFNDPALPRSPAAESDRDADYGAAADFVASSLTEAVDIIEQHMPGAQATLPARTVAVKPAAAVVTKAATLAAVLAARKGTPSAITTAVAPSAAPSPIAGKATPRPTTIAAAPSPAAPSPAKPDSPGTRLESLAEQILIELRRRGDIAPDDFSVSKLLAGITQIAVFAILLLGYFQGRGDVAWLQVYMLLALTLQAMTISLLVMSRQR